MADYKAPLRDMRFVLNEVFKVAKLWASCPAGWRSSMPIPPWPCLEEAGKVTAKPSRRSAAAGDEEGCHWDNGRCSTPAGFHRGLQTYAEGGWVGVGGDPAFGGMGMPKAISAQVEEMVNAASLALACTRC